MLRAYGDGILFGEPYGEGPTQVVWLHGWGRRGEDFSRAARSLAEGGVASVALDLPGFGASPAPLVAGGARQYAQMLVPVIRGMSEDRLVLVGHSFGGRIATVLAATHPELVRSLVLTGVPLVRSGIRARSSRSYQVTRWLHHRGVVGDARMERSRQRYGSTDYRNAFGVMRDVLVATVNESYEDELGRIEAPVYLVWGATDQEVPLEVAGTALALMTCRHSFRVVEGEGHMLPVTVPNEIVNATREALR